jgi:threonine dehydratase
LKREDLHTLGAFKWRGALPTLQGYRERGATAVVTASTGNHGAATAWAAARLGLDATVFVPVNASQAKIALIQKLGAGIRRVGGDFDETKDAARAFAEAENVPFFEDGNEPAQYEGYRAIGREILEQCARPGAVIVPVGNGALIAGIGLALKEQSRQTRLIGVAAKDAPVMALSFQARRPVVCERMATFADGLAVRVAVASAVDAVCRVVDEFVLVSERDIARAVADFATAGIRVEGAAASGLAALRKMPALSGPVGPTVLIVTGRNIDEELWRRAVGSPESFPE